MNNKIISIGLVIVQFRNKTKLFLNVSGISTTVEYIKNSIFTKKESSNAIPDSKL